MTAVAESFDLTKDITVRAPFVEYDGMSAKVKFAHGKGTLEGLASGYSDQEAAERRRQIEWFEANSYDLDQRRAGNGKN